MPVGDWNREQRRLLEVWHAAGVRAVDPVAATRRALQEHRLGPAPLHLLAIGKAARPMMAGALEALDARGHAAGSALLVTDAVVSPQEGVTALVADHPVPGHRSLGAAEAIAHWISALPSAQPVLVLLSGGASAMIAAPLEGASQHEVTESFEQLHALGLDIVTMNAARRQFTRWSGGRLRHALGERHVECVLVSDVPGDELAAVGSGPLIGGPLAAEALGEHVLIPGTLSRFPFSIQRLLAADPPPPVDPCPHHVVASGRQMLLDLTADLQRTGFRVQTAGWPLEGTTREGADRVAAWLIANAQDSTWDVMMWAGELTVPLGETPGLGGRCQQFAVELSLILEGTAAHSPTVASTLVLAAGTDGRDGPTDAAGAFASPTLPSRLRAAGFDPGDLIRRCDTHAALDRVGALYRTGRTGSNVSDLILATRARGAPGSLNSS